MLVLAMLVVGKGALLAHCSDSPLSCGLAYYTVAMAVTAWALGASGRLSGLIPLFDHPVRGLCMALAGFALLVLLASLLVAYLPNPALKDLLRPLSGLAGWAFLKGGAPFWGGYGVVGAAVEELVFRVGLFGAWGLADSDNGFARNMGATSLKLLAVNGLFAVLHWPQPPIMLLIAFLGGAVLSLVLLWSRNAPLIIVLHMLYNAKTMVP